MTVKEKTPFEKAAEQQPQLSLPREFLLFLKDNKKWWLLPMLLSLALIGTIVVLTGAAAPFLPFIYTLF